MKLRVLAHFSPMQRDHAFSAPLLSASPGPWGGVSFLTQAYFPHRWANAARKTPHWRLLPSFAARQRLSWVGGHVPAPFSPLQRAHLQQGSPTRAFDGTNWSASAAGLRAGSSLSQAAQGKAGRSGRQQQRHQEPLKVHFCFSSIRDY